MNKYYLDNVVKRNKRNPNTFWIPSKEQIEKIKFNDYAQLIFVPHDDEYMTERMWVEIYSIEIVNDECVYLGRLANHPMNCPIEYGDRVVFKNENIMNILYHETEELAFNPFD